MDTQIREMLVWIPKENVTYPCEEAILFGLKNCDERNDNIPYVEGKPLRALIKGGIRSRGPTIKEFPEDALTLHPPIQLHKWTVDVWIKFPLRGLGPDKVLIGPDNCKLGMHVRYTFGTWDIVWDIDYCPFNFDIVMQMV